MPARIAEISHSLPMTCLDTRAAISRLEPLTEALGASVKRRLEGCAACSLLSCAGGLSGPWGLVPPG